MTASTHTDRPDITDWLEGDIGVFDTETTGVNPHADRIVTAYFGVVSADGEVVKFREWLLSPGVAIPPGATAVHGITSEFAAEHGQEPAGAITDILDCFAAAAQALMPVAIYNAPYDLTLLDREARRHLGKPLTLRCPIIDPLVLDKHYAKYRKGSRRLADVCALYGCPLNDAHEASADALATGALVRAMGARYPELASTGLRALWVAQAHWAKEQQMSLKNHFANQGYIEKAESVRVAWPIIPATATDPT